MQTRLVDRLRDGTRLGNDLKAGSAVEECDEPLSDDFVIVDDEHAEWSGRFDFGHRHITSGHGGGRAT